MHMLNLLKIYSFVLKILRGNEILMSTKSHNSVMNRRKLTHSNPRLDFVNINANAKFGQDPSKVSQDIVWKQKFKKEIKLYILQ